MTWFKCEWPIRSHFWFGNQFFERFFETIRCNRASGLDIRAIFSVNKWKQQDGTPYRACLCMCVCVCGQTSSESDSSSLRHSFTQASIVRCQIATGHWYIVHRQFTIRSNHSQFVFLPLSSVRLFAIVAVHHIHFIEQKMNNVET